MESKEPFFFSWLMWLGSKEKMDSTQRLSTSYHPVKQTCPHGLSSFLLGDCCIIEKLPCLHWHVQSMNCFEAIQGGPLPVRVISYNSIYRGEVITPGKPIYFRPFIGVPCHSIVLWFPGGFYLYAFCPMQP